MDKKIQILEKIRKELEAWEKSKATGQFKIEINFSVGGIRQIFLDRRNLLM